MAGGGDEEDRTPDLRIANATLSQLSYVPTESANFTRSRAIAAIRLRRAKVRLGLGQSGPRERT
jgi:hypothetical protein